MNESKAILQKLTRKVWVAQTVKESVSIPVGGSKPFKYFDSKSLQSIRTRLSKFQDQGMEFTVYNYNDDIITVTRKS